MKVLIWILCCFGAGMITTASKMYAGVTLGGIPTFLLYTFAFWLADRLCLKKDLKDVAKAAALENLGVYEYVKTNLKDEFIEEMESVFDNKTPDEVRTFLKKKRKCGSITKWEEKIFLDEYTSRNQKDIKLPK